MMSNPAKRNNTKRQAVIVIHGIGEQQPMTTLRQFVDSVLDIKPNSDKPAYYSKPDTFSEGFELRCLSTPGNIRPQTDFFEFYWAHLMPQAGWSRIFDWAWLMLNRPVKNVPRQFRGIWWALWITVGALGIAIGISTIHAMLHPQTEAETLFNLPFGVAIVGLFLQGLFLSSIGDAATYLSPHPKNIAARHAIRASGIALLENLHQSHEYDRIIVVGHSLGSVIGYDILNITWQRYYKQHGYPERPQHEWLGKVERLADKLHMFRQQSEETPQALRDEWIFLTQKTREELHTNKHPWLVTNFVTLGSPLAHADLLLAQSREDLNQKIEQREIPISPPILDSHGKLAFRIDYKLPDGTPRTTFAPYHAAWTACVRWTNLYFPCHWLLKGDFVGGPLTPLFGSGIEDVPLTTQIRGGWFAHTLYWRKDKHDAGVTNAPVRNLQLALDLGIWFEELQWHKSK